MTKQRVFDGPTGLVDGITGRPVRQFTVTGQYYVRATAARHFWGRVLDGAVFLACFSVICVVLFLSLRTIGPEAAGFACAALWFPALYIYGTIWGTYGLFGDRAAHIRSVRITNGTRSGAWIGGWRVIAWSFIPVYILFLFMSMFENAVEHTPGYVPLDCKSGLSQGIPPVNGNDSL